MRRVVAAKYWLILFLFAAPVCNAAAPGYLNELIANAHARQLAQRIEWHNLLHYKPYPFLPGLRSLADDPAFFTAKNGKTDPHAELDATLASFFSTAPDTAHQHPQCAFIARYHWLKAELRFDAKHLPEQACPRFREWRAALAPQGITLVFPAAYLNNPASMYGHTLLRVDGIGQDQQTRLLAYAISYAANTDDTNGFIFAIKGLAGGYAGLYSVLPYYLKVREYSDIESRDVWEYGLNLSPEEVDRLLMHLWELRAIRFDYYFFDENCSYHLLSLLEAARASLRLTDQFRWWAIPSDTVRAVVVESGLVTSVVYRPSRATTILYRAQGMPGAQQQLARELASGRATTSDARLNKLPVAEKAAVLELSYEFLAYKQNPANAAENERGRRLLLARSETDAPVAAPRIPLPAVRPDQGHDTARVALGVGRQAEQNFVELRVRPTYHDLLDDQGGYTAGAQIQFFDLRLRQYEHAAGRLESFIPLDIVSLAPRNSYFKSISWKINLGWSRQIFPNGERPLVFRLNAGAGLAFDLDAGESGKRVLYSFIEGATDVDREFDQGYAAGLGVTAGVLAEVLPSWRVDVYAKGMRFGMGDAHSASEAGLRQQFSLSRRSALRLEAARERSFDIYQNRAILYWQFYF